MSRIKKNKGELVLNGIPSSVGYAFGKAFVIKKSTFNSKRNGLQRTPPEELQRYLNTIDEYENQIENYLVIVEKEKNPAVSILDSVRLILRDPILKDEIKEKIEEGYSAENAVELVFNKYKNTILNIKNKLFRERAYELDQIKNQIIEILQTKKLFATVPEKSIIVANSLSPDQVVFFKNKQIAGIITEVGGITTHSSILARSFGIPEVIGIGNATEIVSTGDDVIIDGYKGVIVVNPSKRTLREFELKVKQESDFKKSLGKLINLPTQTKDGKSLQLQVNLNTKEEFENPIIYHSDGLGLVRTEHLIPILGNKNLNFESFEELQFEIYNEIAVKMYPKTVIFRAFDIGADKFPSFFNFSETNPMLGFRGIRLLLGKPEFFKAQIRAFLKASVHGNVKIMLPMITTLQEIKESLKLVDECKRELNEKGLEFNQELEFGVMIETPAAALIVDSISKYVDFISIGTNDLTQYTVVADRDNNFVSKYFEPFHPAVLRLMKFIIDKAKKRGVKVGICGELASHPSATAMLIGLNFDSISVSPTNFLQVKKWISEIEYEKARKKVAKVLKMETNLDVRKYLEID